MKLQARYLVLASGAAALLIAGIVYAWSVLSVPIGMEFPRWNAVQLSFTFTLIMAMFCVGGILSGRLSPRLSPRLQVWLGAALFGVGYILTAQMDSLGELYLFFGVICGVASGMIYNVVMDTVTKWFRDAPGLCSGILLMGFGLSSFLMGKLYTAVTPDEMGAWRRTFLLFGALSFVAVLVCGAFLRPPGEGERYGEKDSDRASEGGETAPREMIRRKSFWIYYMWTVALSVGWLALVSQGGGMLRQVDGRLALGMISTVVGLLSVCNAIGRVALGLLFDKLGQSRVMGMVNAGLLGAGACLALALKLGALWGIAVGFAVGGFACGGVTPVNSAYVRACFGEKYYSRNLPILNTNLLIASFGATAAGRLFDATGSYMSVCLGFGALALLGRLLTRCWGRRELWERNGTGPRVDV